MAESRAKILLVEDDPTLGYVVRDTLQKKWLRGSALY